MSNFKVEFTLKQHTPLIHFQSDQAGATLRATELKPKFDKFLKEHVFGGEIPKEFLTDKDKDALSYKVKIEHIETKEIEIKNKTYFGNMGKDTSDKEFKHAIHCLSDFKIEFVVFNDTIKSAIENYFASFMAITNFGTRQNKGFGSFYISKKDTTYYIEPIEALKKIDTNFIYAIYGNQSSEKVFEQIEIIYPLMKTGINYPDYRKKEITDRNGNIKKVPDPSQGRGEKASYYKSYLFSYMLGKNPSIGNEKRFIKENFFENKIKSDGITKKYVRAMLGIGDGIEFKDHERRGKIEYSNPKIERFKSPLTFKVIENQLFIIINKIDNVMFNNEFTFKDKYGTPKKIRTPASNDFDIIDFVHSFADYFNNEINVSKVKEKRNIFDEKILVAKNMKFIKASS